MRSRGKRVMVFGPLAIVGMALFAFIGGEIVMRLWNWLLPRLFGWPEMTFWQALGLLVLCRILFGGFGFGGPRHSKFRRRMAERWEKMTPEEREKYRQSFRGRWGAFDPPDSKPNE